MKRYLLLIFAVFAFNAQAGRMTPALERAINDQVRSEFDAAYIYLDMAQQAESLSLSGIANFFTVHFYEELNHARAMMQFLQDQGAQVVLQSLPAPKTPKGPTTTVILKLFETCLHHEYEQTERIHRIVAMARNEKSYATEIFFSAFVEEQVEEEALFMSLVDRFRLAGDNPAAMLELDRELGQRPMPEIL